MATGGFAPDVSGRLSDRSKTFGGGIIVAAAIDLGTTLSGYAYAFRDHPEHIYASNWSSLSTGAYQSVKTPTTVLLDKDKNFVAFGLEAEEKYSELTEADEHHDWYYFQYFKMELYRQEKLSRDTKLKDISNKEMPALDIFAMVIKYLKNKLMKETRLNKSNLEYYDYKWVITVPAIWSDAAKQFMEEAATKAGIEKFRLQLVLEPEAASLFCQDRYKRRERSSGGEAVLNPFGPGHKYIVADLGGGTADIATHEVLPDGTLREIYRASGDDLGGNRVNKAFLVFLEQLLPEHVLDRFVLMARHDYLELVREFEVKKRTFSANKQAPIIVKIPTSLTECIAQVQGNVTLSKLIDQNNFKALLTMKRDKLHIDHKLIKVFFDEPVGSIITKLKEIIQTEHFNINTLLLVGGFADSPFVIETVKHEIGLSCPEIDVCKPEGAGLHVLKGAVLSVLKPKHISERISRYSYGFRVAVPFDRNRHPEQLKQRRESTGKEYCEDVFHQCIEIGQSLKCGQKIKVTFSGEKLQQASKFEVCCTQLFRSTNKRPRFCTKEENCVRVGKMEHHPPKDGWGNIVMFAAEITVGETELHISVINATTQEVYETVVDFLDN